MGNLYDRKPMDQAYQVVKHLHEQAEKHARSQDKILRAIPATDKQRGLLCHLLGMAFGTGEAGDVARHEFLEYVFGNPSSKALTLDQASVLIDWLRDPHGPGPHPAAVSECWTILRAWGAEHGQQEMEL